MGTQQQPNIVFILVDDMGWTDAGCFGSEYYETPHIDRLAAEGVKFTNAYANAPNCAPSRASLMCGKYTPRHGILTVNASEKGEAWQRKLIPTPNKTVLGLEHATIAEALKEAGYACGHVGKWHLGEGPQMGPLGRGFDFNAGGIHKGQPPAGYFSPYEIATLPDGPEGEYLTDRLTDEALTFIEGHADRPFFLYFAHYSVHTPLQAKEEQVAKYREKPVSGGHRHPVYAGMLESTDESVGRVMAKLAELGIDDRTLVVLFSDNGGLGGYAGDGIIGQEVTDQAPLRGGKGMIYEGGIRVPMIVRWPGAADAGAVNETPVIGSDLFPTFLEAAGVLPAERPELDGASLMPLLTGGGSLSRDALFWHFPVYIQALPESPKMRATPCAAVRQGDWKLIEYFEHDRLELYNLKDDIGERRDLSEQCPEQAMALHKLLLDWREELEVEVPTELNPAYLPQ